MESRLASCWMEWNWRDLYSYTGLGSVNICISWANKNCIPKWWWQSESYRSCEKFYKYFQLPRHMCAWNGRCQQIKASSRYTNLNVPSIAIWPIHTRKNEEDRCSVIDFSEFSVAHELPVWYIYGLLSCTHHVLGWAVPVNESIIDAYHVAHTHKLSVTYLVMVSAYLLLAWENNSITTDWCTIGTESPTFTDTDYQSDCGIRLISSLIGS